MRRCGPQASKRFEALRSASRAPLPPEGGGDLRTIYLPHKTGAPTYEPQP
ncbi:hypothetical protein GEOBRER4_n2521 [Citrifermentans bremense]|uniref:Uncharacterized protein n=1 Tax=Citrifermentans bremense TaxID=60035 RepID=A0A7R7FTH1_9BACT|nr:hypothetical protein GEOBRER4_n2521 [Citrifermentans bremense]